MTTDTDPRRLIEGIFAMISSADLSGAGDLIADDHVEHTPLGDLKGIDGFAQLVGMFQAGFSDMSVRAVDIVVDGDRAAWRVTGTGTHSGEFMGIPPTGRTVTFGGVDMGRIAGGKAVEHWAGPDFLGLFQQLGTYPPAG